MNIIITEQSKTVVLLCRDLSKRTPGPYRPGGGTSAKVISLQGADKNI